jgi:uncharacterized protein (TIGR03083 family)
VNDDAATLIGRDWAAFLDLLDGVDWAAPTRLEGWTVEDLARHVHWGMTLETDALELASLGGGRDEGRRAAGDDAAGRVAVPGRRATGSDLVGPRPAIVPALQLARERLLRALAAVPSETATVLPMPYGDVPLELGLQVFVMEAAVHRSDLAHALGRDERLGPGSHAPAAAVLQAFWPALAAGSPVAPPAGTGFLLRGSSVAVEAEFDGAAWGPPTGPHAVVISGDDDAVLLAGYGRIPLGTVGIRVDGDQELAWRLKEYVPGP